MSTTDTNISEIPSETTEEYHANFEYGEEEEIIEEEHYALNSSDFISGPFFSETSTVPENILTLNYSYGYDCKRYFNICAPDENTVVFASGNLIHFFNVNDYTTRFRRSYLGGGIGHITVNPCSMYPHLAVAENGENPPIIIYQWPNLDIVGVLKEGAAKRFAHINYSPDGEMLVSQSYGPDFLITVWRWKKWKRSPIVLRIKSHVCDVYKCMFSPYVPGHLTTGGAGHIKFWKMAQTFTGLKLQGELGRFGKTEISDVVGIFPMPDEKVISGSEWGNILVWEAGLIKVEVFRTRRRKCHNAPIMQLEYIRSKGEIWSISLDGWLRAWEYRVIDEADPPDEDRIVQMIPSYERETRTVEFMAICKQRIYDPDCRKYYAQDGNGGIWLVDLILRADYAPPVCFKRFHAGPVVDMDVCPWGPYIVTLGDAGSLHIYNYQDKILVHRHLFKAKGRAVMWLPLSVDKTGCFIIAGFDDGVVRVCVLSQPSGDELIVPTKVPSKTSADEDATEAEVGYEEQLDDKGPKIYVTQSIKPHNRPLTKFTLNPQGNVFVTGGEDKTIFIFMLKNENEVVVLKPIGFCQIDAIPTCFLWHHTLENTLIVGCNHGELYQFEVPSQPVPYTKISYLLHTVIPIKKRFVSCKSLIRRNLHILEIQKRKDKKVERKKLEIAKIKAENPGIDIDEELYLQDSESEEVLEPLHIPPEPNKILFMKFTPDDTIWLSMGGFDAGYIYEYRMDQENDDPLKATIIEDADDVEMQSYIYSPDGEYLITSMDNGQIRVNRINENNFLDLSDYWVLSMHDNFNGKINKMCFSFDYNYFFSCGDDGNVFSYNYNSNTAFNIIEPDLELLPHIEEVKVEENYNTLSLEEVMVKAELDKQLRLANEHKRKLRQRLKDITVKLTTLLDRNCRLPKSQRFSVCQFIIDDRIMKALEERLAARVELERRKLAYDVEKCMIGVDKMKHHYITCLDTYPTCVTSIRRKLTVSTIATRTLGKKFMETYEFVEKKVQDEFLKAKDNESISAKDSEGTSAADDKNTDAIVESKELQPRRHIEGDILQEKKKKQKELEPFLVGLSPSTIEFRMGAKLTRLLKRYRERRAKKELRQEEWNEMISIKPPMNRNHPDDEENLRRAELTIGDFKLKTSPNYKVPEHLRESMTKKYQQLLDARLRAYRQILHAYNIRLGNLRNQKVQLIKNLEKIVGRLHEIHEELPPNRIIQPQEFPKIKPEDFPEEDIELKLNVEPNFWAFKNKEKKHTEHAEKKPEKKVDLWKMAYEITTLQDYPGTPRELIKAMKKPLDPFNEDYPLNMNPWETETKIKRLVKNIYEQDELLKKMDRLIDAFDRDFDECCISRFEALTACTTMDLHILVLNQELSIVKDFETYENELSANAQEKYNLMMDMQDNIKSIELDIIKLNLNIEKCNEEIKEIQQTFLTAAKENKFWDFLRRIFKKKWRPPKLVNPDESESSSFSSSSSSSSEEDDAGSLDSQNIGPIRLDESICPKGCDKELYDYTFLLRSKRHDQERQIMDERKGIEVLKKDLEQANKKMKIAEQASKASTDKLEEYQAKKQRALNEVPCTAIMKLSQLKHIKIFEHECRNTKLSDTLIFGHHALECLFKRVNELQHETLEERGRFRRNKLHLHRMCVDIDYMNREIKDLKGQITALMITKFGRKVNIDELEESILKRLVQDLKLTLLRFGEEYEKDLDSCRTMYGDKQIELKEIIRENTGRLELLSILSKEKVKLSRILENQAYNKERALSKEDLYFLNDIGKLKDVVKSQQEEITNLKHEIKILNTKALPLEVIPQDIPSKFKEQDKKDILTDYDESLDELFVPPEYKKETDEITQTDNEDAKITDEEIIICIQELISEIAEHNVKTLETPSLIVAKIITDSIEQIPIKYLENSESISFVANIMSELLNDLTQLDTSYIYDTLSVRTTLSKDDITSVVNLLVNTANDIIETKRNSIDETVVPENDG